MHIWFNTRKNVVCIYMCVYTCALTRKKIEYERWVIAASFNHYTDTFLPTTLTSIYERVRNARYILSLYTYMHHIRSLYICVRAHAFIYGRFRRVNGPDARRHDKITLVPNDTAIATRRLNLHTQLLQFNGKYAQPYISYTWWTLSQWRDPAVAVCIWETTSVPMQLELL